MHIAALMIKMMTVFIMRIRKMVSTGTLLIVTYSSALALLAFELVALRM